MEALKDKFLFCYSDAHLDDLKDSTIKEYLDEDLTVIEEYTKDNYFSYDYIKEKTFQCYLTTAKKAFINHDYEAAKQSLDHPFDLDKLFDDVDDFPELQPIKDLLKSYMDMPVSLLGPAMDISKLDAQNQQLFDKMMPGYNPDMSIKNFMKSIQPYAKELLINPKELTELRKHASNYLDREIYGYEKCGLEFNQNLKDSPFGKSFLEIVDSAILENQKKDDLHRFTYAYSLLEVYGITQERDNKNKLKKFTYDSLHRDATHAYFASFCDYLVTDDKGLQVKAHILYSLFGFETKILTKEDFINSKSLLLAYEETLETFKNSFAYDLNHSFQLFDKTSISSNINTKEFKTTHPYFNYFNRIQIINEDQINTYALFCRRHLQANFVMYREIELLTNKLIVLFGTDTERKGIYNFNENSKSDEAIRKWHLNGLNIELTESCKTWGIFIVLTIEVA